MSRTRQLPLQTALLLGLLGTGFGLGSQFGTGMPAPQPNGPISPLELSATFREVAGQVGPAVVSVRAYGESASSGRRGRQLTLGSGVIVDRSGIVVTNNHVVRNAASCTARLEDGVEVSAQILGTDAESDLAVLRLDIEMLDDFAVAEVASDRDVEVGEWVLAMGNPRGLGHTVTAGIVSGLARQDLEIATFEDFIQTDAAINDGNSGGPLIDLEGRVVGINTAVGTMFGGSNGLGFAIPARMVKRVVEDIVSYGQVRRGWMGVKMTTLSTRGAQLRGFNGESRVVIEEVFDESPADRAGLSVGDIVVGFGDADIEKQQELLNYIGEQAPGDAVTMRVFRDGRYRDIDILLAERGVVSAR